MEYVCADILLGGVLYGVTKAVKGEELLRGGCGYPHGVVSSCAAEIPIRITYFRVLFSTLFGPIIDLLFGLFLVAI